MYMYFVFMSDQIFLLSAQNGALVSMCPFKVKKLFAALHLEHQKKDVKYNVKKGNCNSFLAIFSSQNGKSSDLEFMVFSQ